MATRGKHARTRVPRGPAAGRGRHRRPTSGARRSGLVAAAAVPVVLLGGTAAYAFWSASGSGTATAGTTKAVPLTLGAGAAPPPLYPGRQVDLGYTVSNPNAYPVSLTRLTALTITSSDEGACPAGTHLALPSEVTTGLSGGGYVLPTPLSVPAGSSSPGTLAGLLTMKTSAPDGCQGRTFTVSLTVAGSQV